MKNKGHFVFGQLTRRQIHIRDAVPLASMRPAIIELIKREHPEVQEEGFISQDELKHYRKHYMQIMLEAEKGELSHLEKDVLDSMVHHETVTQNIEKQFERQLTFGERLADKIADFGGSWNFIILFGLTLLAWIAVNVLILVNRSFDPYPFILLNLVLSCLAALQAPVIMMSQNRKEDKDRMRSENDYKVNLKAELEIQHLHEKIDTLMQHQWQRLLEIQEMQMDMLEEQQQRKKPLRKR